TAVWKALLENGAVPCGLGCRDTLRLEAAMPLYGHELGENVNPLAAGLGFAIKMSKEDFVGKAALVAQGEPKQIRVGLKATGRGIIREQEPVLSNGTQIGMTTSGTHCPTLGVACAMAYLDKEFSAPGTPVSVLVRGREIAAEVVALPFYKHG
ncbi:MAG: glycine cleavage T C-terminal barrel domain-containing protein, partial [Ruthenibacterium sp.]